MPTDEEVLEEAEKNKPEKSVEGPQLTDIEQLAVKIGWNPDHEGGDREFVSAEDFILRSKEIQATANKQNKSLKKKVDDLTKGLNLLQEHNDTVYKVQVKALKSRIKELEGRRKEAVEDGDTEAVTAIDDQIREIRDIPEELPVERVNAVPEEFEAWIENNGWYNTNREMRAYADAVGKEYAEKKLPLSKVYEMVTRDVKKVFPENFKDGKSAPAAPAVEGASRTTRKSAAKSKYTFNDLSREQQDICKQLVQMGLKTEREYIDELAEIERNQGRV